MTVMIDTQRPDALHVLTPNPPTQDEPSSLRSESQVSVTGAGAFGDGDYVSAERVEGLPLSLVRAYADRAIQHARLREADPGVWVATVTGLDGAYGDGGSPQEACEDLREAVIGWVAVRRRLELPIPALDGLDLNVPARPGSA